MKVLQVVHYFLPGHQAGTEIYTARLARALQARGHEVMVFTSEDRPERSGRFELREDSWNGLRVFRLRRGEPSDFARSYTDPDIDELFRAFLREHRPDAVHFQHTFRLSAGMIPVCKEAGIPAFVTLADFFFICPPILLLRPGLELCPGPDTDACARCGNAIGSLYSGGLPGRIVGAAHAAKRRLPRSWVEKLRTIKQARELADPGSAFRQRRGLIAARQEAIKRSLDAARLVIAPSNFLREKMIAAGAVAPDKIIHSDYGFDHAPFANLARAASSRVRFGFIGTPAEHKGLHVAVLAMNRLADTDAEFHVYGDLSWFPAYARKLKRITKNPRVIFTGRFENEAIGKVLAGLDVLIVPSLWFENSPLTIHEAFLARVPVIVSNIGGMAELVESGGGLTFSAGDPDGLARVMRKIIARPELVSELAASAPRVKTIEENAEEMEARYAE